MFAVVVRTPPKRVSDMSAKDFLKDPTPPQGDVRKAKKQGQHANSNQNAREPELVSPDMGNQCNKSNDKGTGSGAVVGAKHAGPVFTQPLASLTRPPRSRTSTAKSITVKQLAAGTAPTDTTIDLSGIESTNRFDGLPNETLTLSRTSKSMTGADNNSYAEGGACGRSTKVADTPEAATSRNPDDSGPMQFDNSEWQEQTKSKKKRRLDDSHGQTGAKKSKSNEDIVVFIKGKSSSIIKLAKKNCSKFQKSFDTAFGKPNNVIFLYKTECVKVICCNTQQRDKILGVTQIDDFLIEPSLPRSQNKDENGKQNRENTNHFDSEQRLVKRVIYGVGVDTSEEDIKQETGAISVRRLKKREGGSLVPMTVIILGFNSEPPNQVKIGYTPFVVKPYFPPPIRCDHCQRFGHTRPVCKQNIRCSFCSGEHGYLACPQNKKTDSPKCANCNGDHSAAFRECPTYLLVAKALRIRAEGGLPFKHAIDKARRGEMGEEAGTDQSRAVRQTAKAGNITELITADIHSEPEAQSTLTTNTRSQPVIGIPCRGTEPPNTGNSHKKGNEMISGQGEIVGLTLLLSQAVNLLLSRLDDCVEVQGIVSSLTWATSILKTRFTQ
jgi:hypothetical protein